MSKSARREAAELLGLPFVPPGRISKPTARLRHIVRRGADAGPGFVVVLEHLVAIFDPVVLRLLCHHDLPEALSDGPATAEDLASRIAARGGGGGSPALRADALGRVLRYAAVRGFVGKDRRGRFRSNGVTDVLRADHPGSARPWVEFLASPSTWRIFEQAGEALVGREPCRAAHGTDFFTHLNVTEPAEGVAFNAAMEQGSQVHALLLADDEALAGARHVVDVGGGTGKLARVLLRHRPHLEVTVFDLPEVVAAGEDRWGADGPSGVHWVGGDFFDAVPDGGDRYTLLSIVHDWGDEDAVRILRNVREAMGPGARCVVIDALVDDRTPNPLVAATDVMMLLLTSGGRERTGPQWRALVDEAGLRIDRSRPLATGYHRFELVRA